MNEQELERLLVRLVAETAQYIEGMNKASEATQEMQLEVQRSILDVEQFNRRVNIIAGSMRELGGQLQEVFQGVGQNALQEWGVAESTAIKLTAALQANGRAVESTLKDYQDFASELQEVSTVGDDTTLALLQQAEGFQLTGESAKKAVKDALALQAATGQAASSMLRLTSAMAKGDTETAMQFSRMVPALRGVKDEAEFTARMTALVTTGITTMGNEAATGAGQLAQLENQYGDLMEEIGKGISEQMKPYIKEAKDVVGWVQRQDEGFKELITTVIAAGFGLGALFVALGTGIKVYNTLILTTIDYIKTLGKQAAELNRTKGHMIEMHLLYAAGVAALATLIFALAGGFEAQKRFNEAMQEGIALSDKINEAFGKRLQGTSSIEEVTKEVHGLERGLNDAKEQLQELDGISDFLARNVPLAGAGLSADYEMAKQRVKELTAQLEVAKKRRDELTTSSTGESVSKSLLEDIKKLTEGFENQIKTMGMATDEAKIFELTVRVGGKATKELAEAVEALRVLDKAKKEMAEFNKETDEYLKLFQQGEEITKAMRTPLEMFADTMADLDHLLDVGAISIDTWNRGMEQAEKKLDEVGKSAKKTRQEMQMLNAVAAGSAEADRIIRDYVQGTARSSQSTYNTFNTGRLEALTERMATATEALGKNVIGLADAAF